MKKKVLIFALGVLVVLAFLCSVEARTPIKLKVGKDGAGVSLLEGTAKILPSGQKDWRSLRLNDVLKGGDEVSTGSKSRLEIVMPDGSRLRFAEKTRFSVQQLTYDKGQAERNVRVHMAVGKCWANVVRSVTGKSVFELSCNNAVAGVRGTVYRMNVNEDRSALVKVYDGAVEVSRWTGAPTGEPLSSGPPRQVAGPKEISGPKRVSMEEWTYIVKSLQQIKINADGTTDKPQGFNEKMDMDDWVRWNKERDGRAPNKTEDNT